MVQRNRLGNSGTVLVILALCAASWATDKSTAPKADRVVIVKNTRTLTLLNHGQVLKNY
jgi:RecB family endonuclease NucS